MVLRGLTWLVLFQLLGTLFSVLLVPQLPGPILGMLLLFVCLLLRGEVSVPLAEASSSLLRYLPLLLVPPATAVMLHARLIAGEFWTLAAVLCLSLLLSLLFTGWLMQQMIRRQARRREDA